MFETLEDMLLPVEQEDQNEFVNVMNSDNKDDDNLCATSCRDSVTVRSFKRLGPGVYLNDEIINYISILEKQYDHKCFLKHQRNKLSHIFSSYFMTKLLEENGKYTYEKVLTWSNACHKGNLFCLEYIYFVVNIGNMHWTLVVVHIPTKQIRYYNSMGKSGQRYMDAVYHYLDDEHQQLHKGCLVRNEWETIDMLNTIPQQRNGKSITIISLLF